MKSTTYLMKMIDIDNIIEEFSFPFDRPEGDFSSVVGCVSRLICLWDDTHELNPVTLWNPAICRSFQVPDLHDLSDDGSLACRKFAFGFGFDALANDFKILRISFGFTHAIGNWRVDGRPMSFSSKHVVCSADIFSLSSKSWRCIHSSVPLQQATIPVFCNGALHFLNRKDDSHFSIVSFGLNAEEFIEMACPWDAKLDKTRSCHQIAASAKTIYLLAQCDDPQYDIWVMKEYNVVESWTKLFSIKMDTWSGWMCILGFTRKGGLIFFGRGTRVGYPIVEALEIVDLWPLGSCCAPYADSYMESLVLLDDNNCVTHLQETNGDNMPEDHNQRGPMIRRIPGKRRRKSARLPLTPYLHVLRLRDVHGDIGQRSTGTSNLEIRSSVEQP